MKNTNYCEDVEIIKSRIYNTAVNDSEINGLLWSFLTVSANLSTFMPGLKSSDHHKIVQNMEFHRALSAMDLLYPSLHENTEIHDEFKVLEQSHDKAHIFVGYHSGCYNMLLRCIAAKNIPFCIVANTDYKNNFEHIVQDLYTNIAIENRDALEIFVAEDPRLLLKLTKKLSAGVSVFIFIDGNAGTKENHFSDDKNLLKIDFLNHHIYARQGVAYLAYLSKAPIATVIAKRDSELNNSVKIDLIKTVDYAANHSRVDFINLITKRIYKVLENLLVEDYEQWSGWFYVHHFFDTNIISEQTSITACKLDGRTKIILNEFVHLIKHNDNNIFLVMKKNYEIMRIERYLYDVLTYFKTARRISAATPLTIDDDIVASEFIEELIEMNYLNAVA